MIIDDEKLDTALNKTFIWKREIEKKTKLIIYRSIVIPTLIYACKIWKTQLKSKITEGKFLRRITRKTRWDKKRNKNIREELHLKTNKVKQMNFWICN